MTVAGVLQRVLKLWSWVRASRSNAALAWAATTFLVLAALAGAPGISRDEAAVLEAAHRVPAVPSPAAPYRLPPLAAGAAAATDTAFSPLGLSHLRAARLASVLFGALLSAVLVLLAWDLSGAAAALLAPALYWAAPRHLHAGLVATPDIALAALTLATVAAYRRANVTPDRGARLRAAAYAGFAFSGALAARADAWIILPVLAAHALIVRVPRSAVSNGTLRQGSGAAAAGPAAAGEARPHRIPAALVAMAVLGPLVLVATWPSLWSRSIARAALAFAPGVGAVATPAAGTASRGVLPRALVVTFLTVPATLLMAYLGGVAHAIVRIVRVIRRRAPRAGVSDELLLLLCAVSPLAAASTFAAPAEGSIRPWLHAMPFLAVLGARGLLASARVGWPARASPLAASLALLVLWPSLRSTAHAYPAGTSTWNEIAGGAPGAAALGLRRQDGGDAAGPILQALDVRAAAGSRVYWPSISPAAVRAYARDGRIRSDLVTAASPEEADIAVVTLDGASRDPEYRIWSAFRTARPVSGAYLDDVPLAFVYARPGAWR